MFSGQVGIVGHLQVADNTIITAQSGISKSITKPGGVYMALRHLMRISIEKLISTFATLMVSWTV